MINIRFKVYDWGRSFCNLGASVKNIPHVNPFLQLNEIIGKLRNLKSVPNLQDDLLYFQVDLLTPYNA